MNEPEILVFPDQAAGAIEAAGRVAASLADAVGARGRADWATTGGSTPVAISTMCSTARATSPSADPNGATTATSAWAIAASTRPGASVGWVMISARLTIRRAASPSARTRPSSASGTIPNPANVWARARAWPGETSTRLLNTGSSRHSRTAPGSHRSRSPVSAADSRALVSRARDDCSAVMLRSPRSRSTTSILSRAAVSSDGTPSSRARSARGSTR